MRPTVILINGCLAPGELFPEFFRALKPEKKNDLCTKVDAHGQMF